MQSSSGQSQGASGSQVEEAEDEESSSSSSLVPPDELESFREKWKQDLAVSKGNQNLDVKLDDEPDSIEEKVSSKFGFLFKIYIFFFLNKTSWYLSEFLILFFNYI